MTLDEWIVNDDTGISSKTLWAALKGININNIPNGRFDYPHDNSDFGRCYRLVKNCGITKEHLNEVKKVFNWLSPLIDAWDELVALHEKKEAGNPVYNKLQKLRPEMDKLQGTTSVSLGKGISIKF